MISKYFFLFLLISLSLRTAYSVTGCVYLDSLSFEKIVPKFKASLIKFDISYPYGTQQDEYEKVCVASSDISDLLIAEVSVKDYGQKDNTALAEKFNLNREHFPAVILFVDGIKEPFRFSYEKADDFNEENLKLFIRSKSNIYIGLNGCIEEFDKIAEKFGVEKNEDVKKKLLLEAEKLLDKSEGNQQQKSAEVYVKYMRKSLEVGDEFIDKERNRINNIVQGKVSKKKKNELEQKINILKSFRMKDEL